MAPKSMVPLFCCMLIASAAALDVIQILKSESNDYTTFAKLLTDTKLANEINKRQTITVLALNNAAVGAITSLPSNIQKEVLSIHVILDYYDPVKLDALKENTMLLTTLFQSSGQATGQMGFINYTGLPNETQVFGSAVPGAPVDSTLIGVVAARPYNISVLQVSKAIIPPGLSGATTAPPTPTAQSPPTNGSSPTTPTTSTQNPTKPPTGSTTPSSGDATAPSSGSSTTPPLNSAPVPSGSTAPGTTSNNTTPTDSNATPPPLAESPSTGEVTPPTSVDKTTPTEAPSVSDTQAPAAAEGPATDSGANASSPVSTDASDSPAAGVPSSEHAASDRTSSAGMVAAHAGLWLVAMGLALVGALSYI